jgi:hypothetical protein
VREFPSPFLFFPVNTPPHIPWRANLQLFKKMSEIQLIGSISTLSDTDKTMFGISIAIGSGNSTLSAI